MRKAKRRFRGRNKENGEMKVGNTVGTDQLSQLHGCTKNSLM